MKKKTTSGLLLIVISVICVSILGVIFAAITGSDIFKMIKVLFLYFGAPCCLSGILICTTKIIEGHCFGFGMVIYYGTAILSGILDHFIDATGSTLLSISFVIVVLCCYLYWIKNLKPNDDDDC